jgi:hypothetical protein
MSVASTFAHLVLGALAVTRLAGSADASAQGPGIREGFVHVAQGLTSPTTGDGIDAAYRMFSLPDMQSVCDKAHAHAVTQLRAVTSRVQLRVGRPFSLSSLKVVALGASGSLVRQVPIDIEVEEAWPAILDLQSDHIADAWLTPLRAGKFRFRIRTICDGKGAETVITARVMP